MNLSITVGGDETEPTVRSIADEVHEQGQGVRTCPVEIIEHQECAASARALEQEAKCCQKDEPPLVDPGRMAAR